LFLPRRCFYLAVVFTSPLFLPRRCFYRAVVFTAPLFLPRRCFYRVQNILHDPKVSFQMDNQ
jgi:hypothetical protein